MRRNFAALCVLLLVLVFVPVSAEEVSDDPAVTLLFTHDMHSSLLPFSKSENGNAVSVGGWAQLKTLIDAEGGADVLLVDAGDFSMGTLFQTLFASRASELRLLGLMGYDAVTLGNHEFDFGSEGLADMLHAAVRSGDPLPQLLFHPGNFPYTSIDAPETPIQNLSDALHDIGAKETMILEKNGVKIGLFSVLGENAVSVCADLDLEPPGTIDNAKEAVAELKAQGAELIVCLSHSGIFPKPGESEDELLAKAVPDIDVIVSGHMHTYLYKPIIVGNTAIVSCGENGQYLGKAVLARAGERWTVQDYALLPVHSSVQANSAIADRISGFRRDVETHYLSHFGYNDLSEKVGQLSFDIPFDVFTKHGESSLGNLIADAYAAAAGAPPDVAIMPAGYIRWGLTKGDVTLYDVYNIASLGIGRDGLSGYPLIDFYLTGAELRNVAEVDASVTGLLPDAQLFFSGMGMAFDPHRILFNRVTDVWLYGDDGARVEIEPDRLYRVVCGHNAAMLLGNVKSASYGLLSITPKDAEGNPVTDFDARILYRDSGDEIKEWYAIAQYIESFSDGIPETYSAPQGRKLAETRFTLAAYTTGLNTVSIVTLSVGGLLLILILWLLIRLLTLPRRRRKRRDRLLAARRAQEDAEAAEAERAQRAAEIDFDNCARCAVCRCPRSARCAAEPASAEPIAAEPASAEPIAAEPASAEPIAAESASAEPVFPTETPVPVPETAPAQSAHTEPPPKRRRRKP